MITIRPATARDLKSIKALIARYPGRLLQSHLPRSRDFFVAEADGVIVGCCALEIYSRRLAEIRSLAVDARFQGHGIATKLIRRCLRRATTRRVYEVLGITGAVPLFEKLGFRTFQKEKYALLKIM